MFRPKGQYLPMSPDDLDHDQLDRRDVLIAHEAIVNLLINDWSAMDRDALDDAEASLSEALGREPEDLL